MMNDIEPINANSKYEKMKQIQQIKYYSQWRNSICRVFSPPEAIEYEINSLLNTLYDEYYKIDIY